MYTFNYWTAVRAGLNVNQVWGVRIINVIIWVCIAIGDYITAERISFIFSVDCPDLVCKVPSHTDVSLQATCFLTMNYLSDYFFKILNSDQLSHTWCLVFVLSFQYSYNSTTDTRIFDVFAESPNDFLSGRVFFSNYFILWMGYAEVGNSRDVIKYESFRYLYIIKELLLLQRCQEFEHHNLRSKYRCIFTFRRSFQTLAVVLFASLLRLRMRGLLSLERVLFGSLRPSWLPHRFSMSEGQVHVLILQSYR